MATLGVLVIVAHCVFLLQAALLLAASIGGFFGATGVVVSALIGFVLWLAFAGFTIYAVTLAAGVAKGRSDKLDACLRWANALFLVVAILSAVTGLPLAFGAFAGCGPLWPSNLYHWIGLVGSILGFVCFFFLPLVVSAFAGDQGAHSEPHRWWVPLATALPLYVLWGLAWLIAYLLLSGSIDESTYPAQAGSPYKLPFPGGQSSWVIQGNNSSFNHEGKEKHAWDFRRRCGTPVLAARGGTVVSVIDRNDGNGSDKPNNEIKVDHGDGTSARYLHIQQNSARVRSGTVRQGDELAKVGNVGNSLTGHVHFVVERGGSSIPVTFRDVADDKGIPRTFGGYASGNR
jgi:Peptidase family M23